MNSGGFCSESGAVSLPVGFGGKKLGWFLGDWGQEDARPLSSTAQLGLPGRLSSSFRRNQQINGAEGGKRAVGLRLALRIGAL